MLLEASMNIRYAQRMKEFFFLVWTLSGRQDFLRVWAKLNKSHSAIDCGLI